MKTNATETDMRLGTWKTQGLWTTQVEILRKLKARIIDVCVFIHTKKENENCCFASQPI